MRTGNPDLLKSEAKKCGSHYFEPSTMRFFSSRLSPNLHPSETGQDVTYFVTSEQNKSARFGNDPRRYSVHRFKNCKIDTVGEFQAFKTAGAAHTAAKRFARGVTSDGLSGFLPESGVGKLALVGAAAAAGAAIYAYWWERRHAAPKHVAVVSPASVPVGPVDDPNTMFDETDTIVLRPATYSTGAQGKWVVTEMPFDKKTGTGTRSWIPPFTTLQWTPGGFPHLMPNPPSVASKLHGFSGPIGIYDEPAYTVMR